MQGVSAMHEGLHEPTAQLFDMAEFMHEAQVRTSGHRVDVQRCNTSSR